MSIDCENFKLMVSSLGASIKGYAAEYCTKENGKMAVQVVQEVVGRAIAMCQHGISCAEPVLKQGATPIAVMGISLVVYKIFQSHVSEMTEKAREVAKKQLRGSL